MGAGERFDSNYCPIIATIGNIPALWIHRVRVAHDELTIAIQRDSHRTNQVAACGHDGLPAGLPVHVDNPADAEIPVLGGHIGYVNVVTGDCDGLRAFKIAALTDNALNARLRVHPDDLAGKGNVKDQKVAVACDRDVQRIHKMATG